MVETNQELSSMLFSNKDLQQAEEQAAAERAERQRKLNRMKAVREKEGSGNVPVTVSKGTDGAIWCICDAVITQRKYM